MSYVEGFILAVPKDRLDDYRAMARKAGAMWMGFGATSYVECLGDDVPYGELTSFPRAVLATDDEVIVFSWITYADRETRDAVMAKVMADDSLKDDPMPFDGKRMIFGGFVPFVDLRQT